MNYFLGYLVVGLLTALLGVHQNHRARQAQFTWGEVALITIFWPCIWWIVVQVMREKQ